jgi:hypothetical protein
MHYTASGSKPILLAERLETEADVPTTNRKG